MKRCTTSSNKYNIYSNYIMTSYNKHLFFTLQFIQYVAGNEHCPFLHHRTELKRNKLSANDRLAPNSHPHFRRTKMCLHAPVNSLHPDLFSEQNRRRLPRVKTRLLLRAGAAGHTLIQTHRAGSVHCTTIQVPTTQRRREKADSNDKVHSLARKGPSLIRLSCVAEVGQPARMAGEIVQRVPSSIFVV